MTPPSDAAPPFPPEPHLRGLSLTRLAGVDAGRAERLPLERVLENEGVTAEQWRRGEPAWRAKLAEDADAEGALSATYDARLGDAQDRYGRPTPPLDRELAAWLDFVRRFAEAPEPLALLGSLGLRPTDLVRLHRRWSRALEVDAALRARAESLLAAVPGAMPEIHPGETALQPPPPEGPPVEVSPPLDDDTDEDDDDEEDDDEENDDEAPPLWVPLPGWPAGAPGEGSAAEIAVALTAEVRPTVLPSFALAPPAPPASAPPAPPPAVTPTALNAGATVTGVVISPFASLPFRPSEGSRLAAPEPALPAPVQDGEITAPPQPSPLRALPFRPVEAAPSPGRAAPSPAPAPDFGATIVGAPSPLSAAPLPFQRDPRAPAAPRSESPPAVRSVSPLPFRSPSAPADPLEKTAPPMAASPFPASGVPFAPPVTKPKPTVGTSPGLPFRPPSEPAAQGPGLTLEQHASLCAELAFSPAREDETLGLYRLSPEGKAELDRLWQARAAADPAIAEQWRQAYRIYFAFLSSAPRR